MKVYLTAEERCLIEGAARRVQAEPAVWMREAVLAAGSWMTYADHCRALEALNVLYSIRDELRSRELDLDQLNDRFSSIEVAIARTSRWRNA